MEIYTEAMENTPVGTFSGKIESRFALGFTGIAVCMNV